MNTDPRGYNSCDIPQEPSAEEQEQAAAAMAEDLFEEEEVREEQERLERERAFAAGAGCEDEEVEEGDDGLNDADDEVDGSENEDEETAYEEAIEQQRKRAQQEAGGTLVVRTDGEPPSGAAPPDFGLCAEHAPPPPPPPNWKSADGYVPPGTEGFQAFARTMMTSSGVPSNERVLPPAELRPATWVSSNPQPKLQPYQETVSFLVRPETYPNPRMLVVHRTGAGKTGTMIRIADNFFNDRRPKVRAHLAACRLPGQSTLPPIACRPPCPPATQLAIQLARRAAGVSALAGAHLPDNSGLQFLLP